MYVLSRHSSMGSFERGAKVLQTFCDLPSPAALGRSLLPFSLVLPLWLATGASSIRRAKQVPTHFPLLCPLLPFRSSATPPNILVAICLHSNIIPLLWPSLTPYIKIGISSLFNTPNCCHFALFFLDSTDHPQHINMS